ncbi:zinc finger protein 37 [Parasteatoda tepidariorum]|uniref:zinc finger protein 37 n=1 Tax=Parasteatoda tepidariorum TaxID=114398 RepID=UPI001C71D7F7|nr:zinc finger protein 37 [Parasteatoda tepidariorum]
MAIPALKPAVVMNFTESQQACNILEKLWSQRESGRFCDVVLHVQGQKFCAHRNVLAACSPYFDSVLKKHKTEKEQLTLTCQNMDAFLLLLNYMYTGVIIIDLSNVSELLRLSNHFLINKLKNFCAEYLIKYLDYSNCFLIKELAEKYSLPILHRSADNFIRSNIAELFDKNELLESPVFKLKQFFSENNLLIPKHLLFPFICKWLEHNVSDRENDFAILLSFIDWNAVDYLHLENYLRSTSLNERSPKCIYLILSAMEENKMELSVFHDKFLILKSQFGTTVDGDEKDAMKNEKNTLDSDYSAAVPVTVAPLERRENDVYQCDEMTAPKDDESSNSSYNVPDNGADGFDESESSDNAAEDPPIEPIKVESGQEKLKTPIKKSIMTRRSSLLTAGREVVPAIRITRSSTGTKVTKSTPKKVSKTKKAKKPSKNVSTKQKQLNVVKSESLQKRYVSETDTEDDDEEDDGNVSSSDSSVEESLNGPTKKSKWKDGVKCPHCCYIAHSSVRLEQHVSRVHAKDVTYKCKECDFTCKWSREYYMHMKTHFQGPPFKCESCEYTCDRIQFLLSHRMRHTDERPFKCDECDHRARTKANLECHMRCHTGEKPYQCEICERRFAIKASLDQHLSSHREDRPYLCDICGFSTKYQSHLFSHKRIHTGDVFRCNFPNCTYSTPKRSQLGSHHRTHTGVRSHICAICGRAFTEKSHLVRHERIHLNEKPFKCEQCDYSSSRKDKLKEHIMKHHGENASAKRPFRPRKQRRESQLENSYPHQIKAAPSESENTQPQQHIELQNAMEAASSSVPVVYTYDSSHQDSIYNHAVVGLQQLGVHNYQISFMDQRNHQPYHHQHVPIGPTPPSAIPTMIPDQNRLNSVAIPSQDGTNVVGQPGEYNTYISYM